MQLIRAQVIRCCSIRRPLQETGKMLYRPNVRLLGFIAHPVKAHMPTVLRKVTPAEAAEPLECNASPEPNGLPESLCT